MPRPPRLDAPGAIHHVIVRGIDKRLIFRCDADRERFLERLLRQLDDAGAACFAWALMPNHAHLLLRTGTRPLSEMMQRLNTGYAVAFNRRYERTGYVFQSRYHSILVGDDAYLRVLLRYLHLNPLRAGLVASLRALAHYPWAGHAGMMGFSPRAFHATDEALGWFGADVSSARAELMCWMRSGPDQPDPPEAIGRRARTRPESRPLPPGTGSAPPDDAPDNSRRAARLRAHGWSMDLLIRWVCQRLEVDLERVRGGGRARPECEARALIGFLATHELGYARRQSAFKTGVSEGAMSRAIRRGSEIAGTRGVELPDEPPRGRQ